ncbi:MAG TPA: hypothetical protein VHO06_27055 [Polyangia bacterium]|nr:hypothetical protein [Polyangia bacterium]
MSTAGGFQGREDGSRGPTIERAIDAQRHQVRTKLLEQLEKQVDLPAWLVAGGFHLSPIQLDPTKLAFADRHGDTLFLTKDLAAERWLYQTGREPIERGTVVDLMIRRDGCSLDGCVDRMAACVGLSKPTREAVAYREASGEITLRRAVDRHLASMTVERDAQRALESMGLERGTFDGERFGPASAALKDPEDLGHSRYREGDRAIVILERPIDGVAYERSHGKQHATYIYVGDNPSEHTKRVLAHIIADAPRNLTVVAALGRDRRGAALSGEIAKLAGARPVERRPPEYGNRWADQMQIEGRHRESLRRLSRQADPALEKVRGQIGRAIDAGVDFAAIRTAIVRRPGRGRGLDR